MAAMGRAGSRGSPTQAAKPGRILAVDYGRKRIGLALSDEMRLTARPLETFFRTNRERDMKRLRETCRVHGVTHVIVGHPLHMTGEAGEMAEEAARFAARLGKAAGVGVELVDERLTTWEAKRTLAQTRARRKGEPSDDVSAAVLLRDYLDQMRGAALPAEKD